MSSPTTPAGQVHTEGAGAVPRTSSSTQGKAVVHLDLDGLRHIFRVRGWRYPGGPDPILAQALPLALDLFDEANVQATLFAIAEDLDDPAARALLGEAIRRGHEIASHSLTHRPLIGLQRDDKAREIRESRERLQQELGTNIDGFRAPDLSLDRESLELVAQAGYAYDSSRVVNARPAALSTLGSAPAGIHSPLPDQALLELPLPAHARLPLPFHPSYSLVLGEGYFRLGVARSTSGTGPFILLFHLIDFADPLPAHLLNGAAQRLYTLSFRSGPRKRAACRRMLAVVANTYTFVSTRRVVQDATASSEDV